MIVVSTLKIHMHQNTGLVGRGVFLVAIPLSGTPACTIAVEGDPVALKDASERGIIQHQRRSAGRQALSFITALPPYASVMRIARRMTARRLILGVFDR
jgi:hypothetical protein